MSVTVFELMKLPCLRRASVLAGHNGLNRVVTSVSVLEYAAPTDIQQRFYESIEFGGSELVLTGFCSIADDVEAQCTNIRKMADAVEVGVILYYVGLILPKVDQRVIDVADELDFVLICMPENDPTLRYSEVIQEVMDTVFTDRLNNQTFAVDLLEEMSRLPQNQQTVKTLLRIVADRLRSSVVIADSGYQALSAAAWPRNQSLAWDELLGYVQKHPEQEFVRVEGQENPLWIYRAEIKANLYGTMVILIISEGGKMEAALWKQAVEGLRIGMGVWGKGHNRVDLAELVRSIILDDPIKMRRLGSLYHIDVESLSDTWILKSLNGETLSHYLNPVKELSSEYTKLELCAEYEDDIILFPVGNLSLRDQDEWALALVSMCEREQIAASLVRCPALQHTSDVKYAYELVCNYLKDARVVFPYRLSFTVSEIEFVKECREIASVGRKSVNRYLSMLNRILNRRDGEEILDTLSCFLLDQNSSITETAASLFVHKNTVKYRLQKVGDVLGYRIGDIPQSKNLLYAMALRRLLSDAALSQQQYSP